MDGSKKTANQKPTFSGCGMCGAVGFSGAPSALSGLDMNAMVKSMHHRGPNGNGIYEAPSTNPFFEIYLVSLNRTSC